MLVRTERRGRGRLVGPKLPVSAAAGAATARDAGAAVAPEGDDGDRSRRLPAGGAPGAGGGGILQRESTAGAASAAASSALVLVKSSGPPLPPPRWPPYLPTSELPSCRPDWADGRAAAARALYGSRAVRMCAVLERPAQLAEVLMRLARTTRGSPRLTAAWRSRADVHRFLCHCPEKQALETPFKLRSPDTAPLIATQPHARDAAAAAAGGSGGGGSGGGVPPTLAEAMELAASWRQHRLLLQLDLLHLVMQSREGSSFGGAGWEDGDDILFGASAAGGTGCSSGDGDEDVDSAWHVEWQPCSSSSSSSSAGAGAGGEGVAAAAAAEVGEPDEAAWRRACQDLLAPALRWARRELLGRYWGAGGGGPTAAAHQPPPPPPPPYSYGTLALELGCEGGLLPLRYVAGEDRVVVQVRLRVFWAGGGGWGRG
ncbi:hypothetical protein GPECTOR_24g198 [Gonium pectorale]|uniref:Uncharacterized protein n=1 Tax=Gonium pectorale TaxID=33097 RepID=A0A150GGE1_GONPE|nr:hypothetical protein GPECTOR_24g198 [Gonium pectorale]|eukprot:KXZ48909.1 hypothetical protein GPECTOR_24g198 [Gonium pectorale]